MSIQYDSVSDTLSVSAPNQTIVKTRESPSDSELILDFNADHQMVGLTILGASALLKCEWKSHPERKRIPQYLLNFVDEWYDKK